MPSDQAASPRAPFDFADRQGGWADELWTALVGSVDAALRVYHGIFEFTDDPGCVFRIALDPAPQAVTLSDGTRIRAGEPVGALHWWNEHLRRYSTRGPDLAWAAEMRRRVRYSLRLLGEYIEREPEWRAVRAFYGDATFTSRLGSRQIRRVAGRYGFELADAETTLGRRLHAVGDSFNTWALTRAFNPSALQRQPFLRDRHELWIARSTLVERYGRPVRRVAARQPGRQADPVA